MVKETCFIYNGRGECHDIVGDITVVDTREAMLMLTRKVLWVKVLPEKLAKIFQHSRRGDARLLGDAKEIVPLVIKCREKFLKFSAIPITL
jgi:hypothetical protein